MPGKVFVGCKLPHGITLNPPKGSADDAEPVELKGLNSSGVIGGYGITEVDADFFAAWLKEHAKAPMVVNSLVFGEAKREKAEDRAEEQSGIKTGTEGLNPDSPAPGVTEDPEAKRLRESKGG